ncbi:hypothetical protein [Rhodococcus chondri]|nr:hypothetical protein [Rhodococcus sp. CC-R104]
MGSNWALRLSSSTGRNSRFLRRKPCCQLLQHGPSMFVGRRWSLHCRVGGTDTVIGLGEPVSRIGNGFAALLTVVGLAFVRGRAGPVEAGEQIGHQPQRRGHRLGCRPDQSAGDAVAVEDVGDVDAGPAVGIDTGIEQEVADRSDVSALSAGRIVDAAK